MGDLELLKIVIYAICKTLMAAGEVIGYWFGVVYVYELIGKAYTGLDLIVVALIAFAWYLFSRVLISWAEV